MSNHGLGFIELSVLDTLEESAGLTLAEIKRELKIKKGASRIIKNLEMRRFIQERKGKFFLLKKP